MTDLYFKNHGEARAAFNGVLVALANSDDSVTSVRRSHGCESITFKDGVRLRFVVRPLNPVSSAVEDLIEESVTRLREALRNIAESYRHD